jgi:hypothetical protein
MQIYIHRNKENFGPYSREVLLEYIKRGIFEGKDSASYAGTSDRRTVSELLGLAGDSGKGRKTAPIAATRRMRKAAPAPAKRNFMIGLNLALVALVAAGLYLRLNGGGDAGRRIHAAVQALATSPAPVTAPAVSAPAVTAPMEAPAPVPVLAKTAPAPVIAPAPSVPAQPATAAPAIANAAASTPSAAPAPVIANTAPPTPSAAPAPAVTAPAPEKPFDPADLAGNPTAWPRIVHLKEPVSFPAVLNAQVVGSVTVPAGSEAQLVDIQGDQLTLNYQGGTQKLSWKLTDIAEQAARIAQAVPPAVPAPSTASIAPPAATASQPPATTATSEAPAASATAEPPSTTVAAGGTTNTPSFGN